MKRGCDVSAWQGEIDFNLMAGRGLEFVYMRAAYGISPDTRFKQYWQAAKAAGLKRGVYLYFLPAQDVLKQVAGVDQQVEDDWGELPPVLDCERNSKEPTIKPDYQARMMLALNGFIQFSGMKPVIYSSPSFITQYIKMPEFCQFLLWIAHYVPNIPSIPLPWFPSDYYAWQFTAKGPGRYYGVSSASIDLDVMNE